MLGLDTIRSAGAGISRYDDCFERFGHKILPTRRFPGSAGGRALVKQHSQLVSMMRGLLAELGIDVPAAVVTIIGITNEKQCESGGSGERNDVRPHKARTFGD